MKRETKMVTFFGDCEMTKKAQNVAEQVAGLSVTENLIPAKQGRPKREVDTRQDVSATCKECGRAYTGTKVTYKDKSIPVIVTPPRCESCQTAYLTNLRVNKTIAGIKHIGNLKARLTPEQRNAVVNVLANELQVLMDRYAGNSVSANGFDLKSI